MPENDIVDIKKKHGKTKKKKFFLSVIKRSITNALSKDYV